MRRSHYSGVPWALLEEASFADIYSDSFSSSDLDNDSPQMQVLILAAGEGLRLRPLTNDRPKPMIPLGGRPLLEHLIGLLRQHGVIEVAINLHYKPEVIVEHFGDGRCFGVAITYSPEARPLGVGWGGPPVGLVPRPDLSGALRRRAHRPRPHPACSSSTRPSERR